MAGSKKSTTQGRKVGKEQARGARAESERPAQDEEQDSNLQTDQPDKPVPSESEKSREGQESSEPKQSTETPEKPRKADEDDNEPDTAEPSPPQPQKVPKEDDRPTEPSREARGDKGRYREAPPAPEPSGDRPTHRRDRRVSDQVAENDQMQAELTEARRVHDARTRGETVSA